MYSFSVTKQLIAFLESFGFGVIIGFSENFTFFLSGLFTRKEKLRYIISDALFSLFLVFSLFCFTVSYNLGVVRFYLVLGSFLGVLIYRLSFGTVISFLFEKALSAIMTVFFKPFIYPVRRIKEKINIKTHKTDKKSDKCIANKNNDVV